MLACGAYHLAHTHAPEQLRRIRRAKRTFSAWNERQSARRPLSWADFISLRMNARVRMNAHADDGASPTLVADACGSSVGAIVPLLSCLFYRACGAYHLAHT